MNKRETVKLGDVATYINGYAFKPSDWSDTGLPIIRIQNLTGNDYETNYYLGEYNKKYEVNSGDVLISWSASLGVYEWKNDKALLNQHIFKVQFDKLTVDKRYFIHTVSYLLNDMLKETHGSTMKHITKPRFDNTLFPYPSLEIQHQIASTLDKVTHTIDLCNQIIEKLDLLVKARFVEMFGEIDNIKTISDVCSIVTDGTHQPPKFAQNGIPFLFVSNIVTNEITYNAEKFISEETYNELYKRTPIEMGDIVLSTVGSYGHSAVVKSDKKFLFQRHIAYLKPIKSIVNSTYLHSAILSEKVQEQIEYRVKGIAQKTLNLSEIRKITVPIPTLTLQKQFAAFVEQTDKSKLAVKQVLEKAETLKKALMQEYFG